MKKYFILFLVMLFCLTGCGEKKTEDVVNSFTKAVESSKSYKLNGIMEINNGEETFTYNMDVYFLKDNFYKVYLVNQTNNHEQVILKNKEGLYVVTPSLNKSFKFDSIWPENSSQAYILQNLVNDIKNDTEVTMETNENGYIIKSKVNYPNNEELEYQKIYFDKNMNIVKVEVFNMDDVLKIKVTFKLVDLRAKLSEDDFILDDLVDVDENNPETSQNNEKTDNNGNCTESSCENNEKTTNFSIDSIIYPLYVPANTHLSNAENITTENGERVILTFSGEKNFVIVEETIRGNSELEITPVFGEPLMLNETIGAISTNSISWNDATMSYYLVSSDLSNSEMVNVARSLNGTKSVMTVK